MDDHELTGHPVRMETKANDPAPSAGPDARRRRRRRAVRAAVALAAVAVLLLVAGRLLQLPGLGDLFGTRTHDRTGPAVLTSLRDMSRLEGAAGDYQVVVDLERDAPFLPDAVRGTRTLYVGAGSVSAYVELGGLDERAVTVDADRTGVTLKLPHAALGTPALDPNRSYAVSKQRGLLDRLGDLFSDNPSGEQAVQKLAVQRIDEAARAGGLTQRAERNTTAVLEGLLRSLGFERISVSYA
ncbi:DUF4230 domain-containing protein [Streptomyces sp. DK15]|uniref:DUF4230 domain-containing protein n=1 Tax=Streptomyces sp. DK15 TaxID=2957499 RepID=UPI0029A810C8|nr:DUF4230 domain-containing protein [Streptomyces sp. DK15]MDX2388963.1 DUF4230 domain-containing protein [Streptomyces sp. DK15]